MLTCFAPDLAPTQTTYQLSEEESKHAMRVLRLARAMRWNFLTGAAAITLPKLLVPTPNAVSSA